MSILLQIALLIFVVLNTMLSGGAFFSSSKFRIDLDKEYYNMIRGDLIYEYINKPFSYTLHGVIVIILVSSWLYVWVFSLRFIPDIFIKDRFKHWSKL